MVESTAGHQRKILEKRKGRSDTKGKGLGKRGLKKLVG